MELQNNIEINDPKKFGPGMWYSIHNTALKMGENFFMDWIRLIIDSIPCLKCKTHALKYLDENLLENFRDVHDENGELVGMFIWTWKFHNDVNLRLNKKIYDYKEAYRMYTDESSNCSKECGN